MPTAIAAPTPHFRIVIDPRARTTLDRALALDPASKDACKRLAALDLDEGDLVSSPPDAVVRAIAFDRPIDRHRPPGS